MTLSSLDFFYFLFLCGEKAKHSLVLFISSTVLKVRCLKWIHYYHHYTTDANWLKGHLRIYLIIPVLLSCSCRVLVVLSAGSKYSGDFSEVPKQVIK